MSGGDGFRNDLGLDQPFEDAERRWRSASTPPPRKRQPKPIPPVLQELRGRLEREMLAAREGADADFARACERLNVLSPWYTPPTDKEVTDTRTAVQKVLTAVTSAVRSLECREKQCVPWYADRSEVPGFDHSLVDEIGPGNAMRGDHDPVPVLLVCRDLLFRYLERLEAARPRADRQARKQLVQSVVATLLGTNITSKEIAEVLESKGVKVSPHAIDQVGSRLRYASSAAPQPKRGGAPRGPRKAKTASSGKATKP